MSTDKLNISIGRKCDRVNPINADYRSRKCVIATDAGVALAPVQKAVGVMTKYVKIGTRCKLL